MNEFDKLYESVANITDQFDIEKLDDFKYFDQGIKYARKHLKQIGRGSSRVVFQLDEKSALKIALDDFGLNQNYNEVTLNHDEYPIVAKIFAHGKLEDQDCYWNIMEFGKKITPKRFKELTNGVDIRGMNDNWNDYEKKFLHNEDGEGGNDFFINLYSLIYGEDRHNSIDDFCRIDSYGEVNRNGVPTVVLIDYGFKY
jgi:hypothetical protein